MNGKRSGLSKIRAVVISDVPEHLPLVPLPLTWDDVDEFDEPPTKKRDYRFPDLKSFPDISRFSSIEVTTDEQCRYFFYRDFEPLGSSGIRKASSDERIIP
jgi:hypothetical protein